MRAHGDGSLLHLGAGSRNARACCSHEHPARGFWIYIDRENF
jgi:hypothetical protein